MPIDATFRNPCRFSHRAQALLRFLTQTLQDFLAPFHYIEFHRSLMNVHQGMILALALSRKVFLWHLHNLAFCPALRCYPLLEWFATLEQPERGLPHPMWTVRGVREEPPAPARSNGQ